MAISGHDGQFCYKVGEVVEVPEYCAEIEKVGDEGIHFFLTMESAKFHALSWMDFKGYTGEYKSWHVNGQRLRHGWFKDGEWETWNDDGKRDVRGWKNGERLEWCDKMGRNAEGKNVPTGEPAEIAT